MLPFGARMLTIAKCYSPMIYCSTFGQGGYFVSFDTARGTLAGRQGTCIYLRHSQKNRIKLSTKKTMRLKFFADFGRAFICYFFGVDLVWFFRQCRGCVRWKRYGLVAADNIDILFLKNYVRYSVGDSSFIFYFSYTFTFRCTSIFLYLLSLTRRRGYVSRRTECCVIVFAPIVPGHCK